MTFLTSGALLAAVLSLLPAVSGGEAPRWTGPELVAGLRVVFEVEPLGLLYALVAASLWIPNSIYSVGYMRGHHEGNQTRFFACFALALASVMGIAFAGNLFTLFIFYEALSLVTYPLVTHHGSPEARRAGRIYVGILFGTSMGLFLLGILAVWALSEPHTVDFVRGGIPALRALSPALQGVLFALFVLGIGKAALMPFHFWLPAAMVAPTPVSALLHAVAVVKAGVFCVLKVCVYVFGIDLVAAPATGDWLVYLAAGTILLASLIALRQDNLKARLAYSTVSQLSYIVLGAAVGNALGIVGGALHVVMHACGKITLFFCAGAIYVATGATRVSQLTGMGRSMPLTFAAFLLGTLSIIGLPPMGGAWSKWYLGLATLESAHPWLLAVLLISSVLNVAYLLPIPIKAFFLPPPDGRERGFSEAPWTCVVAAALTALGSLALFFCAGPIEAFVAKVVSP
ncbi:MAG: monovalent cation/H+ antiporter subunit D family protein [Planctomycetota bacterium]|nr:MAG: monovalent cation/H+ antiporter subunit D family protein [Planctomycetota bacterium]